ncbi:hypothetical protein HY639_00770 [Candidatus Woesearchaeota archaeon]|nr:hypothetical protein [Candidatus Woesearchaeota archaeon]
MQFAIIVSASDPAGQTIKKALCTLGFAATDECYHSYPVLQWQGTKLYTVAKESVFFEECDTVAADFFIFATKHQSKAGVPSLCTHAVGNWGNAELGGAPVQLGVAPAQYLKRAVQLLEEKNTIGYEVFQEATHHGPASKRPLLFIEIGSSDKEYHATDAGRIIAETVIDLLSWKPHTVKTAVGIGGLHHTPSFKKIQLSSDIALGHICPKYNLAHLNRVMLEQALVRTQPKAELVVLDWKGLGEQKERIKGIVAELGVPVLRTQNF